MNNENRRNYIGGSECAAVLGLSKWKTPYQVWLDKHSNELLKEDNEAMWWGRELEPLVIKKYQERTNNDVTLVLDENGKQKTIDNVNYPWLKAHVDGVVIDKKLIIEAKTTRFFVDEWGEPDSDQIPTEYLIQCAHYCIVLGDKFDGVDIAALGSTSDFRIYHYKRNIKLEEQIIARTKEFWEKFIKGSDIPEVTTKDDLSKIYNTCRDNPIIATNEIIDKYNELLRARDSLSKIESEKEEIENELKLFIKDNSELIDISGKVLATWKSSISKTLDQKKLKESNLDLTDFYTEKQKRTFLIKK